ncbi:hypothetical protein [Nocardioides sp.]|uniref:hypothetical protein n=1 Tax=Nocardioides sp. TaxID=35761 RepID=UPI001A1CA776|nr:hypothetical protein [Nocardioides sp.]MBJ7359013.1 hypothetical protein [Nocardioides sp.]
MSRAGRGLRWVATGLVVGVLLLGCSDEEPREPDESPSASDPTTGSTADPTTEPTSEPTDATSEPTDATSEPTEPAVTPAAGLLLEEETSQVNVPVGEWERIPDIVTYASAAGHVPSTQVISLSDRENFASPASLDEQVKFHNRTLPEGAIVKRQDNVLLDGAPGYYVQWWEKGDTKIQHDIGLDHDGRVISIQMDLDRADPAATEALVASVLASFRWR